MNDGSVFLQARQSVRHGLIYATIDNLALKFELVAQEGKEDGRSAID